MLRIESRILPWRSSTSRLRTATFPAGRRLGQRLKFGELDEKGYWYTVVGVVKQIRESGVLEDAKPAIYRVFEQCDQVRRAPERRHRGSNGGRAGIDHPRRPAGDLVALTGINLWRVFRRWKRSSTASSQRLRKARRC